MARTGRPRTLVLPMDEIRELAAQGLCLRQLAERYGCSRQAMLDRMREAGIPRLPPWSQPGSRNPAWKGGRQVDSDGYILIHQPDHPHANVAGCVREHRLVMEQIVGRYLLSTEVVHHKDGDKQNNAPSNLELYSKNSDHLRDELTGRTPNYSPEGRQRMRENGLRSANLRRAANRLKKAAGARPSQ